MARLTLEANDKPYSPGEVIRGHVDGLPSGSKLSVAFGPRERLAKDQEEKLPPLEHGPTEDGDATLQSLVQQTDKNTFEFKVPDGPFTYEGAAIKLEWIVEATSDDWQAREPVKVVPGAFSGKPNLAGELEKELEHELHWARPGLHYFGALALAIFGSIAASFKDVPLAVPMGAAAAWILYAWARNKWAMSKGVGKMILNTKCVRPGERLSVKGAIIAPRTYQDAKIVLSAMCEAEFHRSSKEDGGKSDDVDEKPFEKRHERPLGTLSAGTPAAFDAAWELPAGPFSYAYGEDLHIGWWVNVQLFSKGELVKEWSEPIELWP